MKSPRAVIILLAVCITLLAHCVDFANGDAYLTAVEDVQDEEDRLLSEHCQSETVDTMSKRMLASFNRPTSRARELSVRTLANALASERMKLTEPTESIKVLSKNEKTIGEPEERRRPPHYPPPPPQRPSHPPPPRPPPQQIVDESCTWSSLKCDKNAKYRSLDGSCNNLQHPSWGATGSPHLRLVPNRYDDRTGAPRVFSVINDGSQPLPNVRVVSTTLSQSLSTPSSTISHLFPGLGQFLDHDLTLTPTAQINETRIDCCNRSTSCLSRECFAITISSNDSFYSQHSVKCLQFVRSMPGVRENCGFGPREQMNQHTHYIDASQVYGNSKNESDALRNKIKGQLRFRHGVTGLADDQSTDIRNQFPPIDPTGCPLQGLAKACILAGDFRANVQPPLAMFHTIFLRLHNGIANFIASRRPDLPDETIFQEARKIVVAQWQRVIYTEFLPLVLGMENMKTFNLLLNEDYTYNPRRSGGTLNEFATAAYRFGHSTLKKQLRQIDLVNSDAVTVNPLLSDTYFLAYILYDQGMDQLSNGLRQDSVETVDRHFTDQIQNLLFKGDQPFGFDLISLNLQRGRDHGLGTYNDLRKFCGRHRANFWNDLSDTHDPTVISALQQLYQSPDDIDLYAGGVSERPVNGGEGAVGPTFACIIGLQFQALRFGDRFWHENKQFTTAQQQQLNKTLLSRLICDHTNNKSVQKYILQNLGKNNPTVACSGLPIVDYSVFLTTMDPLTPLIIPSLP